MPGDLLLALLSLSLDPSPLLHAENEGRRNPAWTLGGGHTGTGTKLSYLVDTRPIQHLCPRLGACVCANEGNCPERYRERQRINLPSFSLNEFGPFSQ